MPLVAKPQDTVSVRRDSALSVSSYISEDDLALDDRSASPAPPSSSEKDTPSRRKSLMRSSTSQTQDEDSASLSELEQARDNGEHVGEGDAQEDAEVDGESMSKKPNVLILAGLLGFTSSCHIDEEAKVVQVLPTTNAPIVVERLSRTKAKASMTRAVLLEKSDFPVMWRTHEETNNWLWGDLVWKTFEAYVIVMQAAGKFKGQSLYEILSNDAMARRMYAGLIDEARAALRWQRVELMDSVTSPFSLDFVTARNFLLLPDVLFKLGLRILLAIREPVRPNAVYCENHALVRIMAPFLNGEVVRIGFESEAPTPINQEILETLSRTSGNKALSSTPFTQLILPPLIPNSKILIVCSGIIAGLAVVVKVLQFAWFVVIVA